MKKQEKAADATDSVATVETVVEQTGKHWLALCLNERGETTGHSIDTADTRQIASKHLLATIQSWLDNGYSLEGFAVSNDETRNYVAWVLQDDEVDATGKAIVAASAGKQVETV